jgi:hypothetical protein
VDIELGSEETWLVHSIGSIRSGTLPLGCGHQIQDAPMPSLPWCPATILGCPRFEKIWDLYIYELYKDLSCIPMDEFNQNLELNFKLPLK